MILVHCWYLFIGHTKLIRTPSLVGRSLQTVLSKPSVKRVPEWFSYCGVTLHTRRRPW